MRVAIIGAGFGGIGMGITLKRAGIDSFTIIDRGERVGGVWRDNTYPGLACDIPSHLYAYSFEPNPDWSRVYSPQSEILAYLERCASRNGIGPHLRLGTEISRADFDSGARAWNVRTADGETFDAEVLVSACGQLSRPFVPDLPGLDSFGGPAFHSSRWEHDVDLAGKRVAVIGTGASTVQIVPSIAPEVARLDLYQRSAPFVVPKKDRPYRAWEKRLFRVGLLRRLARFRYWLAYELLQSALAKRSWIQRLGERRVLRELAKQVPEGPLRAAATPSDELGCKRVLVSSDYYPTLLRPNVELIPHGVRELTRTGVIADDGSEREADVVVFSTGFASTEFLAPMEVRGEKGVELNRAWRDGAEAYLGMTVAGFPNLFLMYGPNTNLGAGSIVYQLESQMNYVLDAVRSLLRPGIAASIRPEVQREFAREVRERLEPSVWNTGCSSWYVDANGRNTNNWPGLALEYRRRTRRVDLEDYVRS
jgi:cation diffusion facilitator CzcD-associated flavoprotein CzcO